jgi:hypothetical protein
MRFIKTPKKRPTGAQPVILPAQRIVDLRRQGDPPVTKVTDALPESKLKGSFPKF